MGRWPAILGAIVAVAAEVHAHDLERTRVALAFDTDGSFVLDVQNDPAWLLLRLEGFADTPPDAPTTSPAARDGRLAALAPVFRDRIVLFVDGAEVRPDAVEYISPPPLTSDDAPSPLAGYRLRGRMPGDARALRWFYGLVADPYPLQMTRADGQVVTEWVHGEAWSTTLDVSGQFEPPARWRVAFDYLRLGYTHILPRGIDHILFVLGLFLLSTRLRPLLLQVTAFTVAHSLTLGLAVYGLVSLQPRIVEPLIALSIAYVAIENLVASRLQPWRLALVFAFGLLHGLGFAGVLQELGVPRREFVVALAGFNLGVEAGQLSVILGAALAVRWFAGRPWYHHFVVVPASLAIAAVGLVWTVTRAIG